MRPIQTYAGVVHHVDVPVGSVLAEALERVVRSAFDEPQFVAAPDRDRPTLSLAFSADPIVNTQWEVGFFLVGLRTDCVLNVEARFYRNPVRLWQDRATAHGHHELEDRSTGRPRRQAEPALVKRRAALDRSGSAFDERGASSRVSDSLPFSYGIALRRRFPLQPLRLRHVWGLADVRAHCLSRVLHRLPSG